MLPTIGIAIGAGAVSALLFSVTMKGTAIAMALAYLAPLPTMIVALAYGWQADLIAVLVASAVVAGVVDPISGLIFAATIAVPAGLLSGLAGLDRLNFYDREPKPAKPYSAGPGTLALTAAVFGFLVSAGAIAIMIVANGGYAPAIAAFRSTLQPSLEEALSSGVDFPSGLSADDLGRLIVRFAPAAIAASTALLLLINLYLAARTVQLSQRLQRPWADLPSPGWSRWPRWSAGISRPNPTTRSWPRSPRRWR